MLAAPTVVDRLPDGGTDMTDKPDAAAPPPKPKQNRFVRILYGVAGGALLVVGGLQLYLALTLPACDRETITDTLRDLFKSKQVVLTALDDIRELASSYERKTCAAHFETADETGGIEYSLTWEGWSTRVTIEKVDAAARSG